MSKPSPDHLLTPEFLDKVAKQFNLGAITARQVRLKEGIANANYLLSTTTGEYVLKILGVQTPDSIACDVLIQNQLTQAQIPCVQYLEHTDNQPLLHFHNVNLVISKKIIGITPRTLNESFCFQMGVLLARFHQSVTYLPNNQPARWLNSQVANQYLTDSALNHHPLTSKLKFLIRNNLLIFKAKLPKCIIHGDFRDGNVLVNPYDQTQIVAIFDFEEAGYNLAVVDLAMTIISICKGSDESSLHQALIDSVLSGYSSLRSLTKAETESMVTAINYVAGMAGYWLLNHDFPTYSQQLILRAESLT